MQISRLCASDSSTGPVPGGEPHVATGWALAPLGALMMIGYIGANLVALGVLQLLHGEANTLFAIALVIGGGTATALAWRRANRVISNVEARGV